MKYSGRNQIILGLVKKFNLLEKANWVNLKVSNRKVVIHAADF
jgi:hypothetical protein